MKGIDISNNNGSINFNSVKNSGVECIYIKATEGTTFQDSFKGAFYGGAKSIGAKTGFYHFLVGTSSPETQAENFYNQIKDLQNDMIPMLDVEKNFNGLNDYIKRFINRFTAVSNMDIGIYSYSSFIKSYISSSFKDYKLWEANYNNKPWVLPQNFFTNIVGHQYSERAYIDGVNGYCDINEFNDGIFLKNSGGTIIDNNTPFENIYLTLQRELNNQGFRDKNGRELVLDGIPGSLTLSACPTVRLGARGKIITWIQLRCGASPDGIFGIATENAVKWMQKKWNILVDGIVGPATWSKLLGLS